MARWGKAANRMEDGASTLLGGNRQNVDRETIGATGGQVRWMVRGALLLVCMGVAIGVPAALAVASLVRAKLFGVEPADPTTIAVAVAAMVALRYE